MSCIHTWQCRFSEGFFPLLFWGYFIFHHSPQGALKYHFTVSTTTVLANCSRREGWNSVWRSHISESNLSESFSLVLMWRYFFFHHGNQWDPKYHFAESTTTVLGNCSKKGSVELCVMKSQIRKQSLRKLLSSSYVRILLFSPWATTGSQISLSRIHDNSVNKLFQEGKHGTLCDEVTHQKAISQKASL